MSNLINDVKEFLESQGFDVTIKDHIIYYAGGNPAKEMDIPMVFGGRVVVQKNGTLWDENDDAEWAGPLTLEQFKELWLEGQE